jgi:hypothetical protein
VFGDCISLPAWAQNDPFAEMQIRLNLYVGCAQEAAKRLAAGPDAADLVAKVSVRGCSRDLEYLIDFAAANTSPENHQDLRRSIEGSITQEIERFVLEHRAKRYLHARISRASIAIRRLVELALKVKG